MLVVLLQLDLGRVRLVRDLHHQSSVVALVVQVVNESDTVPSGRLNAERLPARRRDFNVRCHHLVNATRESSRVNQRSTATGE